MSLVWFGVGFIRVQLHGKRERCAEAPARVVCLNSSPGQGPTSLEPQLGRLGLAGPAWLGLARHAGLDTHLLTPPLQRTCILEVVHVPLWKGDRRLQGYFQAQIPPKYCYFRVFTVSIISRQPKYCYVQSYSHFGDCYLQPNLLKGFPGEENPSLKCSCSRGNKRPLPSFGRQ